MTEARFEDAGASHQGNPRRPARPHAPLPQLTIIDDAMKSWIARLLITTLAMAAGTGLALAKSPRLVDRPSDKDDVQACEMRLCTIVVRKPAQGDDLKCALAKTWTRAAVKYGAEAASMMTWNMGDARCSVQLNIGRGDLVAAMSQPDYTLQFAAHTASCDIVSDDQISKLNVTLAPKIVFKSGEAKKVWVNVKKVDGPSGLKTMVWTAAKLEDKLGLFHKPMIKEINKLLRQKCPEKLGKG